MEFDEEMKEEVWECHNQQGVSTHFFFSFLILMIIFHLLILVHDTKYRFSNRD